MKFFKRLKYFAVGFSLGILFVFFLFKDRDFKWDWLPGNRVTNFIIDHPIKIDKSIFTKIEDKEAFSNSLFSVVLYGGVDFSNSETNGKVKNYIIENDQDKLYISVSFKDSISKVLEFNDEIFTTKNSTENKLINLNLDSKNFVNKISKKEIKLSKIFKCQIKKLNIKEDEFLNSLGSLKIIWEISNPYKYPHPYYFGTIELDQKTYHISFEDGSKRVRMRNFDSFNCPCKREYIRKSLLNPDCNKNF